MYDSDHFDKYLNEYIRQFTKCTKSVYDSISKDPYIKIDCAASNSFRNACLKEKGFICDSNLNFKLLGYDVDILLSSCLPKVCVNNEDISEITNFLNDLSSEYCGNSSGLIRDCGVIMRCEKNNSKTIIIVGGAIIGVAFLGFLGVGILLYARRNDEEIRNLFHLHRMNDNSNNINHHDEELGELVYDEDEYEDDDSNIPSHPLISNVE